MPNKEILTILKVREESQIKSFKESLAKAISDSFFYLKEKDKKVNQTSFAELIGSSQPRVSNIINGNVDQFTVDKLLGFCTCLGINPVLQVKPVRKLKNETKCFFENLDKKTA